MKRQVFAMGIAVILLLSACTGVDPEALRTVRTLLEEAAAEYGAADVASETGSFYGNAAVNAMIDDNHVLVDQEGWAELVIPASLHPACTDGISPSALEVGRRLQEMGYRALLAGGCVRDLVLGLEVSDFEIVSDASIGELQEIFGDDLVPYGNGSGLIFGYVAFPEDSVNLSPLHGIPDMFSGEEGVPDMEPSAGEEISLLTDSYTRDLTINALYYDLETEAVIDYHGGLYDLREGVINTPVTADLTFRRDPTIPIRALRFKAKYDFALSDDVEEALRAHALEYAELSKPADAENQIRRMWFGGYSRACFEALTDYGLFAYYHPPVAELCDTDAYRYYALTELSAIDDRVAQGERVDKGEVTARLLVPAVRILAQDMPVDEAIEQVMESESTTYGWYMDGREVCTGYLQEMLSEETGAVLENEAVNLMIDDSYAMVQENGWSELRIPRWLHGIGEESFSGHSLEVAQELIDAGFEAYCVGGTVRDLVMGTETMDFDITTNADNEQIVDALPDVSFHSVASGLKFGMVTFPDEVIDVAACTNIPASYAGQPGVPEFDPDSLYSRSFLFDSFQRDMTMNALYYDLSTGDIVDYHGGLHDIREGYIDTMVDPLVVFDTEPRFCVRFLRFKARYGLDFSDRVEAALRENAPTYASTGDPGATSFNLSKCFNAGYAGRCYDVMEDYGAFDALYTPVAELYATDAYREYIRAAMDWMDDQYSRGLRADDNFAMAYILWPAVQAAGEAEMAEAAAQVLNKQNETVTIDRELMQRYTDLFCTEARMDDEITAEEALTLTGQPEFEDAYRLLLIRAQTDDTLSDAVSFWSDIMEDRQDTADMGDSLQ